MDHRSIREPQPGAEPVKTPTAHDIDILAKTAWGEDRGDGLPGMTAVCWVARNRAEIAAKTGRQQFGNGSLASACLAPEQFDCWLGTDPNYRKIVSITLDDPDFQLATLAALMVALDQVPDPTNGATGYWADSIPMPSWAEGKAVTRIGHQSYAIGV